MKFLAPRPGRERRVGWLLMVGGVLTLAGVVYTASQGDMPLSSLLVAITVVVIGLSFVLPLHPHGWELASRWLRGIGAVLAAVTVVLVAYDLMW